MKATPLISLFAIVLLLTGCAYNPDFIVVEGGWQQHDSSPEGVIAPAGTYCNTSDTFVVTGGIRADGSESPRVLLFSAKTKQWAKGPNLQIPRFMHDQVRLKDGRVLVIGGRRFQGNKFIGLKSCELISADHQTVNLTGTLPQDLQTPTAHLLPNGNVIAIGENIAAFYDTKQGNWDPNVIKLNESRREHTSIPIEDGRILVIGGTGRDTIEMIDLITKRSHLIRTRLPLALDDTTATQLPDGRIWILGGQNSKTGDTTNRTFLISLDLKHGTASIDEGPRLPHKRGVADHLLFDTERGLILISGEAQYKSSDVELKDAYLIDKTTLAIYALPQLNAPHDDAVGFTLDGTVYVTGGQITAKEGAYMFLTMPRPVKTTESLTIPVVIQ